nr:sushi, von Willebrand factor type A, EGF and pentraxin domain-containing protein 1-like [Crassostrea gigas]
MVYGPSSARCTENGWQYDGLSLPACGYNKCNVAPYQSGGMYTDPYYGDTVFVGTRVYFKCHTSYYLRCGGPALCMPGHLGDFAGMLCVCEEVRCYKHRLNTTSIVSPDKNDYSYNEPVHFHCDGDHILHGPSSARCTENGWKYDGPSLPVCRPETHSSQVIGK